MKKILLFLTLLLSFQIDSSAQWTAKPYGGGQNFNCVNYFSSSDIWIGGVSSFILKTVNGGTNWTPVQIYDSNGNWIETSSINSIAVINPTTVLATGLLYSGNREHLLTTENGGTSWSWAIYELGTDQYLNSIDLFSTRGIAVGNNGHIIRSENSGTTWSMINRTSGLLRDVKFVTFDTVIAVGENLILRSVDGGASFTWTNQTGSYRNVSCAKNTIYIGVDGNTMLKSEDYGTTYTTLNLPFNYPGVLYAIDKNTVLAAGTDGIYISKNGGGHWDKYALPSYSQVKMFDFLTPNSGIAVGDAGYIVKTDNLAGAAIESPAASFSVQNGPDFCQGDSVKLLNTTNHSVGFTYEWKLDGTTFSTSYHAAVKLTSAGTHTITLTANTGGIPSTASVSVAAKGHTIFLPIDFTTIDDTTCAKNVVGFVLTRSKIGAKYQLRKGFAAIGPVITGNDSTLRFIDTVGITTPTLYNIKEVVTECFTDSVSTSKMIYVQNSQVDVTACKPPKNFCYDYFNNPGIKRVRFNEINHGSTSEINNYFDYSCCYQTTVSGGKTYPLSVNVFGIFGEYVRAWIDYNNDGVFSESELVLSGNSNDLVTGNVTIPLSAIMDKYLRMRIKSDRDSTGIKNACRVNCGQIEDYAIKIPSVFPVAGFTKSIAFVECNAQATFKNTSTNAASYTWDFGDGTATSDLVNPIHNYTVAGTYTITLTATNSLGTNSTNQAITVTVPLMPKPAACVPVVTTYNGVTLSSIKIDTATIVFNGGSAYKNYTCTKQLHFRAGQKYDFIVTSNYVNDCGKFGIWLDYNNDGAFTADELISPPGSQQLCYGYPVSFTSKVKETTNINVPLRMRVMVYNPGYGDILDGCNGGNLLGGEVDDFTVFIDPILSVKADFTVEKKNVCSDEGLSCTNTSTYAMHYLWDFGDGETDTTESPFYHKYKQLGTYTIKLKVSNSISADSITKINYVNSVPSPGKPVVTLTGKTLVSSLVADKYQWTNMDSAVTSGSSATFTPLHDANYQLVIYNSYGCTNYGNFAYFPVHPEFTFYATTSCDLPAFMTFATIPKNTEYNIYWGDGSTSTIPKNSGLPYHDYTIPGTYTVKVVGCNELGCDSLTRTDYVTIYPKTAQPVIVENAGTLSTSVVAPFYQWYYYGQEIPGATSSSYTPATTASGSGLYKVVTKTDKGCTNASTDFSYYPVRAVFTSDTSSFCGVDSAKVYFFNASTNTSSYTWDFGDGTTSTEEWPIHVYSSPGFYTVKLKACGALTCDSLIQTNYIRIYTTPFTTSIIPQGYTTLCFNSNDTVVLKAQTLAGATYKWQIGGNDLSSTDSLFVVHTWSAGYYNALVTDKIGTGCTAKSPFVLVDIDYNCVWPGDANNDHVVDYLDLLPIGLYYGESGASRYTISDLWKGYPSFAWGNGGDLNHSDCNGDGTVNYTDTLAIHKNLTLTHAFIPIQEKKQKITDPVIYFKTASTTYLPGTWVTVDIIAGDANVPVNVLYGIAFMINYDQSLIEPGTASINFSPGWFIQNGSSLSFSNIESTPNIAYLAATAIDHQNKTGYGKIAALRFKTSKTVDQSSNLKFAIGGLKTIDASGAPLIIYPQDYTINIDPVITGIDQQVAVTNISVYPNPYVDKTTIAYSLDKKSSVSLEVYSVYGQKLETLVNKEQAAGEYKLSFSAKEKGYSEGVYFIKITIDGAVSLKRIVEL